MGVDAAPFAPDTQAITLERPAQSSRNTSQTDVAEEHVSEQPKQTSKTEDVLVKSLSQEKPLKPSANDLSSIPNGGLTAWLQVVGGFMLFFNTWGILNTFGVYQTYYESGQLFTASSSNISWIGSIQAYLVMFGGLISGPVYDRGYLRALLVVGGFGVVFGHMMLSICTTFWQALLAQGFCVGLGAGMLFVPGLAVLPTYFNTRLGLAVGVAASGSSFGGIIYPIVFFRLLDQIGFGWSVRVVGFIALVTSLIPIMFMKMRVKPAKPRAFLDSSAFTDWPFVTYVGGCIIGFIGLYCMLFYISYYGEQTGITDATMSFYLVPILNASSMFGRVVPNWLSDKVGPLNLIMPGAIICGILNLVMLSVHNLGGIVVVALAFGFFSGVFVALPPVVLVMLTKDKTKIGTRIGMGFTFIGIGALSGGPGGGAVLQHGDGIHWTNLWLYAGLSNIVAGIIFLVVRLWRSGFKLHYKT